MASTVLHLRIGEGDLQNFKTICKSKYHRDHNDMARELLIAFAEGRVTLTPTEGQDNLINEVYTKGEKSQ